MTIFSTVRKNASPAVCSNHIRAVFIPLILAACLFVLEGCRGPSPDIVIINIDDMGWRDVGFMGSRYYVTPNIDELAGRGMVFTDAYAAASNCTPSRACLMSGQWTPRHGIHTVGSSERGESRHRKLIPTPNTTVLAEEVITLAEVLKEAGYSTCHAGKWHLSENPCDHGFEINIGGTHSGSPRSYYPPYGNVSLEAPNGEYLTDNIMNRVLEYLREAESPFFLHYTPYAVHAPIHPVDSLMHKYQGKSRWMGQGNPAYATMIENLDRNIGRLVEMLESKGGMKNTLIVFTSDNGGHFVFTRQRPLRSGKGSYYEGGIRVPMFIVWERNIPTGEKTGTPVTNLDLFPTIVDAAALKKLLKSPGTLPLDGTSLMPLFRKRGKLQERPLFWHFPIYLQAYDRENDETRDPLFRTRPGSVIRVGDWKLHQYFEDWGIELYNLATDTAERFNLAETNPGKAAELLGLLENWREETGAPVPTEPNPDYVPDPVIQGTD
jgi:arylsulfatase A-like enzyme